MLSVFIKIYIWNGKKFVGVAFFERWGVGGFVPFFVGGCLFCFACFWGMGGGGGGGQSISVFIQNICMPCVTQNYFKSHGSILD